MTGTGSNSGSSRGRLAAGLIMATFWAWLIIDLALDALC